MSNTFNIFANLSKSQSFGFNSVTAGQKRNMVQNDTPQLVASANESKFTVSGPVTKALNVAPGDCIVFYDNIDQVRSYVDQRPTELREMCSQNGIDLDTEEGYNTVIRAMRQIRIGKGIPQYNANGSKKMGIKRWTVNDKTKWLSIAENKAQAVDQLFVDLVKNFYDEIKGENPDLDVDVDVTNVESILAAKENAKFVELISDRLTADILPSPEEQVCSGSKCGTSSGKTGVGMSLGISDNNMWIVIKCEYGENPMNDEEAHTLNRYFDVDLEDKKDIDVSDGCKTVTTRTYGIKFREDKKAVKRGDKSNGEGSEDEGSEDEEFDDENID